MRFFNSLFIPSLEPGDWVDMDEEVMNIETDKVAANVMCPGKKILLLFTIATHVFKEAGVVTEILVKEGDKVLVGA